MGSAHAEANLHYTTRNFKAISNSGGPLMTRSAKTIATAPASGTQCDQTMIATSALDRALGRQSL